MKTRLATLELIGFVLIALCLGVVQFNLWAAQVLLFSLAALVWLLVAFEDRRRPDVPGFFLPLAAFGVWTLVSAAFSMDPAASFKDSRQLLMLLMVPIVARFARGWRASSTLDVIIAM